MGAQRLVDQYRHERSRGFGFMIPQRASKRDHTLFFSAYLQEEEIRVRSLALVQQNDRLDAEISAVEHAVRLFVAITQDYQVQNQDDGVLVHLGIRLCNLGFSAVKLTLSGYYQQAFALARDITETAYLLHYLISFPEEIAAWRDGSEKERKDRFSPIKVIGIGQG